MLYKIPDGKYHGSYIDLDCIQSIHPEYGEISVRDDEEFPDPDLPPIIKQGDTILLYTITMTNGQEFYLEIEDYKAFTKLLIKEGLMMPDPQESEEVLSNDPWRNNGQQEPKDGKDSTE